MVCVALFALIWAVSAVRADLVADGGFEKPVVVSSNGAYTHFAGAMDAWTVSGSVDEVTTFEWTPHSGNQSLDLNGLSPGTISQNLATHAGHTYDLTFYMSGNFGDYVGSQRSLEVYWGGSPAGTFTFTRPGSPYVYGDPSSLGWTLESALGLTASGSSTELKFVSLESSSYAWGATLDDISVRDTTPEPGTLSLLLLGLPGAAAFLRRRKQA
jgi:hypothetical protein